MSATPQTLLAAAQAKLGQIETAAAHVKTVTHNTGALNSLDNIETWAPAAVTDITQSLAIINQPPVIPMPTPAALSNLPLALIFEDKFAALDSTQWLNEDGYTNKNGATTHAANVTANGQLALTTPSKGSGAEIVSKRSLFTVGDIIEAAIWVPGAGQTIYNWPAFWVSGPNWPLDGEYDLFEGLGGATVNQHWQQANGQEGTDNSSNPAIPGNFGGTWITVTAEWTPGQIAVWWGQQTARQMQTHDDGNPKQIIFTNGDGNTPSYPASMLVDYVRVWAPGS